MSALAERTNGYVRGGLRVVDEPRTLGAYERLEALCDPGSLHVIRSTVLPRRESKRMREGDGVVGAAGTIAGGRSTATRRTRRSWAARSASRTRRRSCG